MLEYLRNASEKPVAKILMGILIFSFVGWGVAEWVFRQAMPDDYILKAGAVQLSANAFNAEKSRALAKLDKAQQRQIYAEPAMAKLFYQQILSGTVSRMMLEQRAHDTGLVVSDSAIAAMVRGAPEFQQDGRFSPEKFDYLLMQSGMSESDYTNFARREILRQMAAAGISAAVRAPNFMAAAEFDSRYAKRKISYARVSFGDFNISANPTEDQLRAVYAQNQKMIPEIREVSYVLVAAKMEAPDNYDKAYALAQKLEDAIIGGEPMESAAKKHGAKFVSAAASEKSSDEIIAKNAARLFAMEQGIESEILETKQGFAIMRVEKIEPAHAESFESMKKQLANLWRAEEQKKQAYVRANEMLGGALKDAKSATVGRADGAPLAVLNAAFANPAGTKTIAPDTGAFFVLRIDEEIAPAADNAKLANIKAEADKMLSRMISDDYTAFLSREYPVKVNEKVYRRLMGE